MKVGIISESPTATTGFGTTCRYIASGLAQAGFDVSVFGINAFGETFERNKYAYKIWAVGNRNLIESLSEFLNYEEPDVLFINFDVVGLNRWFKIARALGWNKPIVSHFVVDCLPLNGEYLEVLEQLQGRITPTHVVASYLNKKGIKDTYVAPHGVDQTIFHPLPNREKLRANAGLNGKFVIGVFGRNCERKQQPRVMQALSLLKRERRLSGFVTYFHSQVIDDSSLGGWDLREIARYLDIEDFVIFTEDSFNQLNGVPYQSNYKRESNIGTFLQYSYVERLNCCDLIINPAFCGGFELITVEAQACGIPVAITNDRSIMQEVAGEGAYMLEPVDSSFWKLGGMQHFVAAETIQKAILELSENAALREQLMSRGFENVRRYSWKPLMKASVEVIKRLCKNA